MSNEEIIRVWNNGFSKTQVVDYYMRDHNRKSRDKKIKRITKIQALAYVEPILFNYEMLRTKGEKIEI